MSRQFNRARWGSHRIRARAVFATFVVPVGNLGCCTLLVEGFVNNGSGE